jgi:predicted nucleic acid-binding protein
VTWALLDANVYIGHWELGLYQAELAAIQQGYVIRHSSVVLSELRRGARTKSARRLVDSLYRLATVQWSPTAEDWWEAGRLIRLIGDEHGWDTVKRRQFQNDTLIALTARQHGATVVTANVADFTLLAQKTGIRLHML